MGAPAEPQLGVVLVHGFNSSPQMWDPVRRLISTDMDLGFVDTLPFAYATSLWSFDPRRGIPSFDTVADSLKEFMDTEAGAFRRLMVVSHSQGGLIVQRYLTRMTSEGRGAELARIRRVVLLACPNNGSEALRSLRRRLLRNNPQERQLRPLDEQIADTHRAVLRDIIHATEVSARQCPIPFSVYAGDSDGIVRAASARGAFPNAAVLPGDHTGIARPDTAEHRTYTTLRRLLLASAVPEPQTRPVPVPRPAAAPAVEVVPAVDEIVAPYAFPDTFALVAVAERIPDVDDPGFRRMIIRQMRRLLSPRYGFEAPYSEHPRDHLVEIIERCRAHLDQQAALTAFVDAIVALRPDDAATTELRTLIQGGQ